MLGAHDPVQAADLPDVAVVERMARRALHLPVRPGPSRGVRSRPLRDGAAALLVVDVVMLAVAGATAAALTASGHTVAWLFASFSLVALGACGSYRAPVRLAALDGFPRVVAALSIAALATHTLGELAFGAARLPLGQVALTLALAVTTLTVGRALATSRLRSARQRGNGLERVLIVGAGQVGRHLAERLDEHPEYGLRCAGFIDADPYPLATDGPGRTPPFLGGPTSLGAAIESTGARHVVLAFSPLSDSGLIALIRRCQELRVKVSVVPRFFETIGERVVVDHIGAVPLVRLRTLSASNRRFVVKHVLDRVLAVLALVVLAPLIAVVAVGIKLESSGPVFFRQCRVGRDGHQFDLLKFRSMREGDDPRQRFRPGVGAAPGGVEGADRRTRLGRFLRRTSLDELPQLANVAKGEMSLVGPRPERPEFVELFGEQLRRYDERHRVRSGITGWAQVQGLRGQTSIAERVEWDNYYIENWSLWLDVKILMLTLRAVLRTPRDA